MRTEMPAPTCVGTDRTRIRNLRRRKKRQIMRAIQRIQARQNQQKSIDHAPVANSSQTDLSVDESGTLARVHVRFGDNGQASKTTVEPVEMVCDPDAFDDLAESIVATDPDQDPDLSACEALSDASVDSDETEPPLPANLVFTCVEHGDTLDPEWRQRRRKRPHTMPVYPAELAYDAQQATLLADTSALADSSSHDTVEGRSAVQPTLVEYDQIPQLFRPPRAGDCIAYKTLALADDYTPRMTDWRVATVLTYDNVTDQVTLDSHPPPAPGSLNVGKRKLNSVTPSEAMGDEAEVNQQLRRSKQFVIDAPDDASFLVDQVDSATGTSTLTTESTVAWTSLLDVRLVPSSV
ncbi:hypothetical protein H4R34_000736 [Dimargaris verticillata]|uniref:Coilin tudor domain-containing protein n=1 Tax=Dimargaris verticillata TaxID=2761393 RepID=A0A9W8B4U2_9FUNG|nr:hypothetical protein H4R34_000736 [Dimargaris verticillata]